MPKSPKTTKKAEVAPRTWKPCTCFAVFGSYLPSDPEDDNSAPQAILFHACGDQTQNEFKQGHDAKLKSALQRCFREGLEYAYEKGGMLTMADPLAVAASRGWSHFMTPGKPKAEKKAKSPKSGESKSDKLDRMNLMKAALKVVKANGLVGDDGKPLQVTPANSQDILDGKITQTAADLTIGVGSSVKLNYRGKDVRGLVTEVKGERAKVTFTTGTGNEVSRTVELASLVRS